MRFNAHLLRQLSKKHNNKTLLHNILTRISAGKYFLKNMTGSSWLIPLFVG